MSADELVRATEIALARITGTRSIRLELLVDGVNKTLTGRCKFGDFFLRLSPQRLHSSAELRHEARVLAHLSDSGDRLAAGLFFEAEHAGSCFDWGGACYHGIATHVAAGIPFNGSPDHLQQFATALARLHAVAVPPNLATERADAPPFEATRMDPLGEQIAEANAALAERSAYDASPRSSALSILHGDAWPGNARYSDSQATLFDFEHTSIGSPVADIANFAWWLAGKPSGIHSTDEMWNAFLAAYRGSCPTLLDLGDLPKRVLATELQCLWFLNNYIHLSPEVREDIAYRSRRLVRAWRDATVSANGAVDQVWNA